MGTEQSVKNDNTYKFKMPSGHEFIVDEIDADFGAEKCYAVVSATGYTCYVAVSRGAKRKDRKLLRLHRLIMERILGRPLQENELVDHHNGNGLDNRRVNLRLATHSQNIANSRLTKRSTSGFKGVTWSKKQRKWQAQIGHNKRNHYLGVFDTPEEAHEAYKKAAIEMKGEFARFE